MGGWDLPIFGGQSLFQELRGFMETSRLPELSVHELIFYLLAIVQELSRRFPWTSRSTPASSDHPSQGWVDPETAGDSQPPGCTGKCVVCRAPCIRLQPGHKHCKCKNHLHWR